MYSLVGETKGSTWYELWVPSIWIWLILRGSRSSSSPNRPPSLPNPMHPLIEAVTASTAISAATPLIGIARVPLCDER